VELNVVKPGNEAAGTVAVSEANFAREYNEALVHQVVTAYMSGARQGTRSQKTRSEVAGGGKKPWRQKGTGRARAGSIRSPLWRGGGVIFGPKPRDYTTKMNRKERRSALRTALMARIDDITVVKDFGTALEAPKTREITEVLGRLGIAADTKVLIVLTNPSEMVRRSVRNLDKVKLISANHLNVFDLLHANSLVVGEDALTTIQEVYGDD